MEPYFALSTLILSQPEFAKVASKHKILEVGYYILAGFAFGIML